MGRGQETQNLGGGQRYVLQIMQTKKDLTFLVLAHYEKTFGTASFFIKSDY